MKVREFNKNIRACSDKKAKLLIPEKILRLDLETRKEMVHFIIRKRGPIITELLEGMVDSQFDSWLSCMGYMYTTKSKSSGFVFRHTSETCII